MARVHRGTDVVLGRDVAVKLLTGAEPEDLARFRGESRLLARLAHPGIVTGYDAGSDGGTDYLVMELVEGPSLSQLLRQRATSSGQALPPDQAAAIGRQVADALAAVHAAGVTHRDVKPGNVLLDARGRAHLADFGIARSVGATRVTRTGMTIGTAAYLAPEQVAGEPVGPPADVYSLGLVLLEALTGAPAYDGSGVEVAMVRLSRAPFLPPTLPAGWPSLLGAMTARDPVARPRAVEVAAALAGNGALTTAVLPVASAALPEVAAPVPTALLPVDQPPATPAVGWVRRRRMAAGVAAALLLAVGVGGALLSTGRGPSPAVPATPARSHLTTPAPAPSPAPTPTPGAGVAQPARAASVAPSRPPSPFVSAGRPTRVATLSAAPVAGTSPGQGAPPKPAKGHGKGHGKGG